ncbi:rhomboid family intramembrane serine protease, partial [Planctomycetota bacterium]
MLIPFKTDAPVYHVPYGTIGIIVVNVLMYFATAFVASNDVAEIDIDAEMKVVNEEFTKYAGHEPTAEEEQEFREILEEHQRAMEENPGSIFVLGSSPRVLWLTLDFDTINPLQWFTHNFMHADIMHLIGNMIFLWGFGLVVEGKLGLGKFVGVYAFLCLLQGAIVQLVMFFASDGFGFALGASGAIYGLMAIAVLWAPKNEMSCVVFFRLLPRVIEIQIVLFGALYLAMQIFFFWLNGFGMSSEALHLTGVMVGIPVGMVFLKRKWVDCEGWDFHSVYLASEEARGNVRDEFRNRDKRAAIQEERDERAATQKRIITSIQSALEANQPAAATSIFAKFESDLQDGKKLPTPLLLPMVVAMHQRKQWRESIPLLVELLQRQPAEETVGPRLKLAQILIQVTEQPRQAVAVLKKLPSTLTEK